MKLSGVSDLDSFYSNSNGASPNFTSSRAPATAPAAHNNFAFNGFAPSIQNNLQNASQAFSQGPDMFGASSFENAQ